MLIYRKRNSDEFSRQITRRDPEELRYSSICPKAKLNFDKTVIL